ncbi:hypothetical protein HZP84_04940 [Elizabethkingia anophelis]|nr:hypothetical protein [Elizabethkingia anophelis]QQM28613.1 hypothetical protein JCR23_00025 [Elizabethkingia sp. M8]EHM7980306.1 hypothetical protein [Elizabethkingia anophelis]EHM8031525.1 hypothetical protein [Elizabethkingia anophelis]EHZ9534479.1 hypothetical protein [Elizabethkingia anophelis]
MLKILSHTEVSIFIKIFIFGYPF